MTLMRLIVALTLVGVASMVFAGSANTQSNPTPTCPTGYVFNKAKGTCEVPVPTTPAQLPGTVTLTVSKNTATASDVATGRAVILVQGRAMTKAQIHALGPGACLPMSGLNSGVNAMTGERTYFPYGKTLVCRDRSSPTGYRRAECSNPFIPKGKPRPRKIFRGKVLLTTNPNIHVIIKASAVAIAVGYDQQGRECGRAEARASARIVARLRAYVRSKGKKNAAVRLYGSLFTSASTRATASVTCGVIVVPQPPPQPQPPAPQPPAPQPPAPQPPQPPQPPPAPGKGKVAVTKHCIQDGVNVSCPTVFGFTVNGANVGVGGGTTTVGEFNAGTSVTVCEVDSKGWVQDKTCDTGTVTSGATVTFVFTNRKTTPPPPSPVNRPPSGSPMPPPHVIVSLPNRPKSTAPACVGSISDPDGDQVSANFSFSAGTWSSVFTDGDKQCVIYSAPETVQEVTMNVTLTDNASSRDSRLSNASTNLPPARFPIVPDINP